MNTEFLANLAILVLAGFVGFAVTSKVANTLAEGVRLRRR